MERFKRSTVEKKTKVGIIADTEITTTTRYDKEHEHYYVFAAVAPDGTFELLLPRGAPPTFRHPTLDNPDASKEEEVARITHELLVSYNTRTFKAELNMAASDEPGLVPKGLRRAQRLQACCCACAAHGELEARVDLPACLLLPTSRAPGWAPALMGARVVAPPGTSFPAASAALGGTLRVLGFNELKAVDDKVADVDMVHFDSAPLAYPGVGGIALPLLVEDAATLVPMLPVSMALKSHMPPTFVSEFFRMGYELRVTATTTRNACTDQLAWGGFCSDAVDAREPLLYSGVHVTNNARAAAASAAQGPGMPKEAPSAETASAATIAPYGGAQPYAPYAAAAPYGAPPSFNGAPPPTMPYGASPSTYGTPPPTYGASPSTSAAAAPVAFTAEGGQLSVAVTASAAPAPAAPAAAAPKQPAALPPGWTEHKTDENESYWAHDDGRSTWDRPTA